MEKTKQQLIKKVEILYNGNIPQWINIKNKNTIIINTNDNKKIKITKQDIEKYYLKSFNKSGIDTISTFSSDWRIINNLVEECSQIFGVLHND